MKKTLLTAIAIGAAYLSHAQFNYTFSATTQTYVPLTGATSITGSTMWDEESYKIPLGFSYKINGITVTDFCLLGGDIVATDTSSTALLNGFGVTGFDLWDRGNAGGSSAVSPIRYVVTGTAPNRIFKAEIFNAGIADEFGIHSTNFDSVNFQVWLYETTNVFEIHMGDSKITNMNDYTQGGKGVYGYFKNLDMNNGNIDKFYYLKGDSALPTLDSTPNVQTFSSGVNTHPVSGTVYRFTPKPTSVKDIVTTSYDVTVYPTICTNDITINNKDKNTLQYRVMNMNGAEVRSLSALPKGETHIVTNDFPAGIYLLQLQSVTGTQTLKFKKI
ncbi:MAG: T9SS type A sorting domain-containing protein [Bacteroidetes bacterium]|nr:T9SS type A sorting domain-containing protein [Bacteroidota bacterium]